MIRNHTGDHSPEVRQAALCSISLRRDKLAFDELLKLLRSGDPHDQRLAAEALGRLRDPRAVPEILSVLEKPSDRPLDHALIYALIEIGDAKSVESGLKSSVMNVRRASMIALDQMPGNFIKPEAVLAELDSDDVRLKDAAWWIVSRHPKEWGGLMTETASKIAGSIG